MLQKSQSPPNSQWPTKAKSTFHSWHMLDLGQQGPCIRRPTEASSAMCFHSHQGRERKVASDTLPLFPASTQNWRPLVLLPSHWSKQVTQPHLPSEWDEGSLTMCPAKGGPPGSLGTAHDYHIQEATTQPLVDCEAPSCKMQKHRGQQAPSS